MLYMLDTDIVSYVVKSKSASLRIKLASIDPSTICISAITQGELLYGLKRLPPEHRIHLAVRRFLKVVRVLAWDAEASNFYADIRHQLVSSGQPIGELDMMIAAHSMAVAAILVTNNLRHYERIRSPLQLENWS